MRTVVAVYSATGNSLYLAKLIPDADVHLIDEFMNGTYTMPEDTDRLALVFPANAFSVPYPMRRFISEYLGKRDNSSLGYVYAFITCAGIPLYTAYDAARCLEDIGVVLSYAASFRFPDTYLPLKKNAPTEEETEKTLEKTMSLIKAAIDDTEDEKIKLPHRIPGWRIIRKASPAIAGENKKLSVSDRCTGCGVCASICPMENISIENGRAVINSNCLKCFACYHRCPVNAIEYGKAQGQYKGLVKTEELRRR